MATDDMRECYPLGARIDGKTLASADLTRVFTEVHTARLALRRLQPTDEATVFAIHGNPAINRYNHAGPAPDQTASEDSYATSCMGG